LTGQSSEICLARSVSLLELPLSHKGEAEICLSEIREICLDVLSSF